ncbi:Persephin [Bagarius yarrelli]|uniref:Persephin n=1 Tax=Bagarius yarrelli TaxID=175774 RepID=A0A556TTZ7_BAGYA|nr:Persephin [Bagarius yarrelli]
MCFLLKIAMLLFCFRVAEGHWLHKLLASDPQEQATSSESGLLDGTRREEGEVGDGSGRRWGGHMLRSRRSAEDSCGLHSILLQVRDLGLGYDSEETVLFKYCSGGCPRVPSNHDLTLTNLRLSGALPHTETWHHAPCCRPTRHEDMAFLDIAHRWHKIEKLSASACSCVG